MPNISKQLQARQRRQRNKYVGQQRYAAIPKSLPCAKHPMTQITRRLIQALPRENSGKSDRVL